MKELNGFMAVFTSPRGNIVSVVNFEQGGDECIKKYRVRRELAREVANGYCSPDFFEHMDADVCEKIMHQMCNSGGCKVKITPVTASVEEVCQN